MVLFTGDAGTRVLDQIAQDQQLSREAHYAQIRILKFPHHGSSDGISQKLIDVFKPQLALISVGKDNLFGHPNQTTLAFLARNHIPIARTDQQGDLELSSDGLKGWIKYQRKAR
jgi:competence protein ComEC